MSAPKIRYHLNLRAALILAAIGLTAALGLYVLWGYQEKRILKMALKQVKEFQDAAEKAEKTNDQDQKSRNNDLALRHLTQYLDARPNDPEGLDIKAELLFEAKDLLGAASVYEHLIKEILRPVSSRLGSDLRLMSWGDGSGVPTSGNNLVIVGVDNNGLLHIRIFDAGGNLVTDPDETKLPSTQAGAISTLKQQLPGLLPPHVLTDAEKTQVITEATSIVGQTPRLQTARRRLAEIYIAISDFRRNSLLAKLMPEQVGKSLRYNAAELHAKNLLELDEKARAQPLSEDAKAHLLYAMALEGQIVPGQTSRERVAFVAVRGEKENEGWEVSVEDGAILEYENALELNALKLMDKKALERMDEKARNEHVRDFRVGAMRLAGLYQKASRKTLVVTEKLKKLIIDTHEPNETFVGFLKAHPAARRLADLYQGSRKNIDIAEEVLDRATAELEQAILLDPENLMLILMAAENAMRLGSVGTFEPHFWLDQVPRLSRDDPRVLTMQGMVEYTEQKSEAALATWRRGLEANPSDVGLSQRLALVLLELGRDEEAAKIIAQYRRLVVSKSDPVLQFLEGIQDEHAGRFSRAIASLESARGRLPESFQTHVHLILARCQEKQGDFIGAAKTYRAALGFDPKSLVLRQLLGRLLLATQPEEAAREFEQGLASSPDQPALLVSLAEARLQQQKALPQEQRNWAAFDAVFRRATAVVPSSIALALLNAERLAADAQADQAISFLREAVAKNPKSAELAGRLADYLRGQGRVDQALEVLTQASDLRAAGDRGSLRVQRALALTSLGQGREARTVLLRDVNQLPPADRDEVWTYLFLLCKSQGDPETTRAIYNEWVRLLPDDPRPKFALLDMDIEANDQKAIHDRLESLIPHNDQGDFIYRLVQARQRLVEAIKAPTEKKRKDRLNDADTLVESVLHEFKIDTVALLLKGQILEAEGAAEKAADSYNQAWARGNVDALVRLVDLWTRLGRKPELDRLRQNDKTKQLDSIVARAYLRHGDKREAARIARQSLAENPAKPSWQVGILEYLGKIEEVETSLRAVAEQQPDKLEPWLALARFHATPRRAQTATDSDRRHKVEVILEEIEPLLKDRWPDELLAAECRFAAADWPAAERAFAAALKRHPQLPEVQAAAARYRTQKGRPDAAEACLSHLKAEATIAKFKPLLKAGWPDELLAAECRFAAADWPAADQAFDAALKRYPQLPEVQAAEARYRTQKGRPDAAEACLRRLEAEAAIAAEIKPRLKNRWPEELLAAECRFAAADWPAADRAFDAALKHYPEAPEVQAAATRYQAQKGRPDAAEACLRRLKVEATIAEAKQRVKLPWPELIEAECRWAAADWPAADQAFDAAVKRYPDARDLQLTASRYYEERGRLDVAEACLRRMLNRNPDERGAARELAVVLSSQGDRPGAWKQALELLGPEGPKTNTPEERLARAIVLGRGRDLPRMKQAIDILQALVADIPAESSMASTARDMLTRFLLAAGQADQASKVASFAAGRGNNSAAIALYAETLIQSRQFDAAEEQRKRLEQLDPENPFITNLRARLILGRSKPAEAAVALENAYLARENSADAELFGREVFSMMLEMGPDANARGVAERLGRRLAGHNPALSWMTASILASRGERDEALALCRTAVEAGTQPGDLREICKVALEVAVASRSEAMALKKADEVLDAAVQRASETDDPLVMKAMIGHLQRRFDEEVRLYRIVLKHQPRNTLVLNNLAYALSEGLDQPTAALEKIDEILSLGYRSAEFLDTRGVILMRLGQLDEAIKGLEEAVHSGHNGIHFFHLARAYQKAGREAEFRTALEQAEQAGLTLETIDPFERAEFEKLRKL